MPQHKGNFDPIVHCGGIIISKKNCNSKAKRSKVHKEKPCFEKIVKCRHVRGCRKRRVTKPPVVCNCKRSNESSCVDEACDNFSTRYFCDRKHCPAGEKCANVLFNLRRPPSLSYFRTTDGRGWGLRLCEPVSEGRFIAEL